MNAGKSHSLRSFSCILAAIAISKREGVNPDAFTQTSGGALRVHCTIG